MSSHLAIAALVLLIGVAPPAGAAAERRGVGDPLERPALALRVPGHSYFLALAETGATRSRLVAAGERGVIVYSDDDGISWKQARVPVAVTLTALYFVSAQEGWAVGHGGVILHTADGGATWSKQLDGLAAARLAHDTAAAGNDESLQRRTRQLLADGPDKPFLAVHFDDPLHGFVVGAYGLIFGTDDGGRTWQSWLDRVDNPKGLHFNAIAVDGSRRYLVGEQGLFLRSDDGGKRFLRLASPYPGSLFSAVAGDGTLMVGGLKGNTFRSADGGANWSRVDGLPAVNIVYGRKIAGPGFLFINQSGQILVSDNNGRALRSVGQPSAAFPALAALLRADGSWIVAGQRGVAHFSRSR